MDQSTDNMTTQSPDKKKSKTAKSSKSPSETKDKKSTTLKKSSVKEVQKQPTTTELPNENKEEEPKKVVEECLDKELSKPSKDKSSKKTTKKKEKMPEVFEPSDGKLKKLLEEAKVDCRIQKQVFDCLKEKLGLIVKHHIKSLHVDEKKITTSTDVDLKEDVKFILPVGPFREHIKYLIKQMYDVTRVSPDILKILHYLIEKDVITLCADSYECMKNNTTRVTLFVNEIDYEFKKFEQKSES